MSTVNLQNGEFLPPSGTSSTITEIRYEMKLTSWDRRIDIQLVSTCLQKTCPIHCILKGPTPIHPWFRGRRVSVKKRAVGGEVRLFTGVRFEEVRREVQHAN